MIKKLTVTSILILVVIAYIYYKNFYNYYKFGENDNFKIKVGKTFQIKLDENGSTGYSYCWLNENESKSLKIVNREYVPGLNAKLGYDGAGGTIIITFKGISTGHETIKLANCPLGPEQKNCSDSSAQNTTVDNEFIIDILK